MTTTMALAAIVAKASHWRRHHGGIGGDRVAVADAAAEAAVATAVAASTEAATATNAAGTRKGAGATGATEGVVATVATAVGHGDNRYLLQST